MFKYALVLALCVCLSSANDLTETERKKDYHLLYGGGIIYYLTFLLIKVKIVAVIGTLIAVALFAGKIFALFKYFAHNGKYQPEVVYSEPHYSPYGKEIIFDSPPPSFVSDHSPSSYGSDHSPTSYGTDHSSYGSFDSNSYVSDHAGEDVHKYGKGRKNDKSSDNILDMAKKAFKGIKLTELAFDAMHIKTNECKRRFLCEALFHARGNDMLSLGLTLFNDTAQTKYESVTPPTSLEECRNTYSKCEEPKT